MARRNISSSSGVTWTFDTDEDSPLSERMNDLQQIFNYYGGATGDRYGSPFVMLLLSRQADFIKIAAQRQEIEIAAMKKEMTEMKKQIADLKDPPCVTLDKATPKKLNGV